MKLARLGLPALLICILSVASFLSPAPASAGPVGSTTITGKVFDKNNKPVKDALVQVTNSQGMVLCQMRTRVDGSFSFTNCRTGAMIIKSQKYGIGWARQRISMKPNTFLYTKMTLVPIPPPTH